MAVAVTKQSYCSAEKKSTLILIRNKTAVCKFQKLYAVTFFPPFVTVFKQNVHKHPLFYQHLLIISANCNHFVIAFRSKI